MENFGHSSNILCDYQFKYIPKMEFQKVLKKVEKDRREKHVGYWGNVCSISSADGSDDEKESSVTRTNSVEVCTIFDQRSKRFSAPLFGPPRKYGIQASKVSQPSTTASSVEKNQENISSVHIVEEVNAADVRQTFDAEIQVPQQIIPNDDEDDASQCSSDNDETLHSEMLELCNQIENVNGSNSSSEENLNQRKLLRSSLKTENEHFCCEKKDGKFNYVEERKKFKSSPQPTATRQTKVAANNEENDSTNSNNVYNPNMRNQLSKAAKQQQRCDEKSSVKVNKKVVSPVESRKCARSVKAEVSANGKSQVVDSAHLVSILGKVTGYQEKISQYIDCLREIINDPPELEDINDLNKRQRRALEFTNRFARNHLYQIGRMAEEVRLMPDNPMDVATKVNLLFHAIMQAVQTYLKNVEMFIYNSYPDKLFVLVDFIINVSKICFDRKVFDKTDTMTVKMLRKSVDMKRFLEMNKSSTSSFGSSVSLSGRGRDLNSRNSYAHEKLKVNEKISVYGKPKRPPLKAKSPYDAPHENLPPRKTLSRGQKLTPHPTQSKRPTPAAKSASPQVKKSISNISTMVQKEIPRDVKEEIENLQKVELENPKQLTEIMEMLRNVAKDKIQEFLVPYFESIPTSRVTSDIKPKNPPKTTNETVERIAPNIQYLYVKSQNDSEETLKPNEKLPSSVEKNTSNVKLQLKSDVDDIFQQCDNEVFKKRKQLAEKERRKMIKSMVENPLYVNEQFDEPWKIFADVSETLIDDMLKSIIKDFDFDEEKFVENFFQHELAC